ncbi:hypothetical protein DUNSADRAFT_6456 [Dunaliella salina]|uniref:Uncharacterized protein n=1 Tax=Dunaliella salina TaxID=3046 RepID=A0ABQ7H6Y8_DUNSA|nr:hypothetical protein DUNSADRAFT_6456 [Dunaliella salina]|eukprot:KAF5842606.1 hypothetical protein DUNSADRAFT_6456 [Dunaliella salina]
MCHTRKDTKCVTPGRMPNVSHQEGYQMCHTREDTKCVTPGRISNVSHQEGYQACWHAFCACAREGCETPILGSSFLITNSHPPVSNTHSCLHYNTCLSLTPLLGYKPSKPSLQRFFYACIKKRRLIKCQPDQLTAMLCSLAKLGCELPPIFVASVCSQLLKRVHEWSPREVSNTMWALARMRQQLPTGLLSRMMYTLLALDAPQSPASSPRLSPTPTPSSPLSPPQAQQRKQPAQSAPLSPSTVPGGPGSPAAGAHTMVRSHPAGATTATGMAGKPASQGGSASQLWQQQQLQVQQQAQQVQQQQRQQQQQQQRQQQQQQQQQQQEVQQQQHDVGQPGVQALQSLGVLRVLQQQQQQPQPQQQQQQQQQVQQQLQHLQQQQQRAHNPIPATHSPRPLHTYTWSPGPPSSLQFSSTHPAARAAAKVGHEASTQGLQGQQMRTSSSQNSGSNMALRGSTNIGGGQYGNPGGLMMGHGLNNGSLAGCGLGMHSSSSSGSSGSVVSRSSSRVGGSSSMGSSRGGIGSRSSSMGSSSSSIGSSSSAGGGSNIKKSHRPQHVANALWALLWLLPRGSRYTFGNTHRQMLRAAERAWMGPYFRAACMRQGTRGMLLGAELAGDAGGEFQRARTLSKSTLAGDAGHEKHRARTLSRPSLEGDAGGEAQSTPRLSESTLVGNGGGKAQPQMPSRSPNASSPAAAGARQSGLSVTQTPAAAAAPPSEASVAQPTITQAAPAQQQGAAAPAAPPAEATAPVAAPPPSNSTVATMSTLHSSSSMERSGGAGDDYHSMTASHSSNSSSSSRTCSGSSDGFLQRSIVSSETVPAAAPSNKSPPSCPAPTSYAVSSFGSAPSAALLQHASKHSTAEAGKAECNTTAPHQHASKQKGNTTGTNNNGTAASLSDGVPSTTRIARPSAIPAPKYAIGHNAAAEELSRSMAVPPAELVQTAQMYQWHACQAMSSFSAQVRLCTRVVCGAALQLTSTASVDQEEGHTGLKPPCNALVSMH